MAKEVKAPLVDEPETEEEYASQYSFQNCTINITMAENCQVNIGTGKPTPWPPPQE